MTPDPARILPFATQADWEGWLAQHHATESDLWVQMFKKGSDKPSLNWEEAVVGALIWGWIDGVRYGHDAESFVQRFTPRRKGSRWSQKNCGHVERLIATGRMQPAGLVHVDAAKADGRWESAYAGHATMEMPQDFLDALAVAPETARASYAALSKQDRFMIYYRITTAKRPETRAKRIADFVQTLVRGASPS